MTRKKALLLFAKKSVPSKQAFPNDLVKLLSKNEHGLEINWAYFEDLIYCVSNTELQLINSKNDCSIENYSVVYFRFWGPTPDYALASARICKIKNIPFIDSETLRTGSHNKLNQYINLHEAKINIPRTLIASTALIEQNYEKFGFSFPFIAKSKGGTRGKDNYLVRDKEQLKELSTKYTNDTFVIQEFLPNSGDYRVIVAGDKVEMVIRRQAKASSHLNNTSQGASATVINNSELPDKVLDDCIKAASFFGRQFAGVDILKSDSDGQYYCLEVNRAPQIEHSSFEGEKAEILAKYLASF